MESTKGYYLTHILLRNIIFYDFKLFNEKLNKGPEVMKKYLLELWNSIDESKFEPGTVINDKERVLIESDFDITFNEVDGIKIFFIIFPETSSYSTQAKAVAIVLCKDFPRYITMEGWTKEEIEQKYTIGEWEICKGIFKHNNYGKISRNTVECFATSVKELLKN